MNINQLEQGLEASFEKTTRSHALRGNASGDALRPEDKTKQGQYRSTLDAKRLQMHSNLTVPVSGMLPPPPKSKKHNK